MILCSNTYRGRVQIAVTDDSIIRLRRALGRALNTGWRETEPDIYQLFQYLESVSENASAAPVYKSIYTPVTDLTSA